MHIFEQKKNGYVFFVYKNKGVKIKMKEPLFEPDTSDIHGNAPTEKETGNAELNNSENTASEYNPAYSEESFDEFQKDISTEIFADKQADTFEARPEESKIFSVLTETGNLSESSDLKKYENGEIILISGVESNSLSAFEEDDEISPSQGKLTKLLSLVLVLFFCFVSLCIHYAAVASLAKHFTSDKIKNILTKEVFGTCFAVSVPEYSDKNITSVPSDNQTPDTSDTREDTSEEELFPIEKSNLAVSEKKLFTLNNQTRFSIRQNKLEEGGSLPSPKTLYEKYGKDAPAVLIIHTHGTEAYSENTESYSADSPFRSDDITKNVVSVGEVMAEVFREAGINVIHDTTMYDKDGYRDSYTRSRAAVSEHLKENPSITYIFDVHRDAIIRDDKTAICPVGIYNGEETAQIMLVVGTDQDGADHKNWRQNLALAFNIQKELFNTSNELARSINLRTSAFNQGLSEGYLLLEVGSCANTLVQAKRCAILSAVSLSKVITGEVHPVLPSALIDKYASE